MNVRRSITLNKILILRTSLIYGLKIGGKILWMNLSIKFYPAFFMKDNRQKNKGEVLTNHKFHFRYHKFAFNKKN